MRKVFCIVLAMVLTIGFVSTSNAGPRAKRYAWEKKRKELLTAADAVLCYGGGHHRTPYLWDQKRLAPFVTYTDTQGKEHWLFDGFIFLEFADMNRSDKAQYAFETGQLRDKGVSAGKQQWGELIDYYFESENGVNALEQTVKEATGRLGDAPTKRRVIIVLPDPVIHEHYIDTLSSTTYWGELDGHRLDFNKNEDRLAACKWYIDRVRAKFAEGDFQHVELAGFYWLREIVTRPQDTEFSYFLTRSDILLPHIADYVHQLNYSFNWIPYYGSRGYDVWSSFGFDQAYLQPNYYWKAGHDMKKICDEIAQYDMAMELEFEPTLLHAREGSDAFRERFRAYMEYAKARNIYGSKPFAYYHGTNGFYDLATSADEVDRALYHELCEFVIGNPLRAK